MSSPETRALLGSTSAEALMQAWDIQNKEQFARIMDDILWKIENVRPITLQLSAQQFDAIRQALKAANDNWVPRALAA